VSDLRTAREALLAEALGEAARLVQQLDAMAPKLDASREAVALACERLSGDVRAFEARLVRVTEHAQAVALRHIAARIDKVARETMAPALRALLREELDQALRRAGMPAPASQKLGALPSWLTHLVAALAASAVTWTAATWLGAP
jgi:hypothetical protein